MGQMRESIQWKKEWLLRYLYALQAVNRAAVKILEAESTKLHALDYETIHNRVGNQHGLEEYLIKMERLRNDWSNAKARSINIWFEIGEAIESVPDPYYLVLFYRYKAYKRRRHEQGELFEGTRQLTWEEIADRLDCSRHRVCHLHGEALELLKVPEEWKIEK